ncbi:homoserine kinase [Apibacter sp. B2966]|uniref:homoserine kinase n=1 Tax=Apibacter sp. B2966 TaxID=2656761 RepID=UPI00140BFF40|nr:homoserine kinase [Apibacter sp. B2966]QII72250.1 homoserine kinase [Apibacter sp. B2966]
MKEKDSVHVFAPATSANFICGYDILGLALNEPGDEVFLKRVDEPGIRITKITGDQGLLPIHPDKNTVSACVKMILDFLGKKNYGIEIELHKKMPIGSGLGSSAASTIAGLFAINQLLGEPLSKKELLPFALKGEELACGHGHADNVAPSLMGGITLIRSYQPLEVINLPVPTELCCSIIFPHVEVQTRAARQILKNKVELKDAVSQWGNIAGLITGLFTEDYNLLSRSLQDQLIEPTRSILIPEFEAMRRIAMECGALGFGISGSGPSVVAFTKGIETAKTITAKLKEHLKNHEIESNGYSSPINCKGATVLS